MYKINCLIIDDEELARDLVENYLQRLPHLNLVAKCANPIEAIPILEENSIDLIFLDIQMPELTGIEFLKTLLQKPFIILTTAYKEYALEGYELDVVDFLLKPFRFERFLQAVNKTSKLIQQSQNQSDLSVFGNAAQGVEQATPDYLLVKANHKVHRVRSDELLFIESMREYLAYYTTHGRIVAIGSLKRMTEILSAEKFIRIHKSFIVAKEKVKTLEGNTIHIEDRKIPIGSSYRNTVIRELFKQ